MTPENKTMPLGACQLGLKGLGSVILPDWRPEKVSDEGYTPRIILDKVEALAPIDTDPCWSPYSLVSPRAWAWTIQHNGLIQEWFGHIFMNPPYSLLLEFWLRALGEVTLGRQLTAVTPLDPTTKWSRMANQFPGFYVDLCFRAEFHRPFARAEARKDANRGSTRIWFFGFSLEQLLAANIHLLGNIQPTGGLKRWMDDEKRKQR